jgi:hypothetical protein
LDFQTFPRISKLFPWPFRGKSRGYRSVEPESRFLQNSARPRPRDEPPGDSLPNALTIHHSANFDFRKEIVGGDFPEGPQGQRGVACANAEADRRDARAIQLRQRAPSRGGAAPIEKVWRRLRAAKFGNSYPVRVNLRAGTPKPLENKKHNPNLDVGIVPRGE